MTEPDPWAPLPPPPDPAQPPAAGWWSPVPGAVSGPPPRPPRRHAHGTVPWPAVLLTGLVCAVLGGSIGGLIVHNADKNSLVGSVTIGSVRGGDVSDRSPRSVAAIAAKILPSVVSIDVKTSGGGDSGSGIVLSRSGYILTNNHVIAAVKSSHGTLTVVLPNKTTVPAKIVGHPDPVDDIAVIKIGKSSSLRPATLGDSDNIVVGDPVIAVGSPLGLAGTVTSGIISALNRPVEAGGEQGVPEDVIDAIQTDAAINPGNSGGPLVDSAGAVIGINSAIASLSSDSITGQQSGSIGLGFAIPINEAKRIAGQIITRGYSTHAIIGVNLDPSYSGSGAKISTPPGGGPAVSAGSPAAKAGMQAGDVIIAVNGERVTTADELIVAIRAHVPGQRVSLTFDRGSQRRTVSLVLGSAKSE
ncbi:MAG TPA: trypsin-like peptidase domain-containing protein [Mycobacteriales bacterium]|nr:trypsin-like peptidase domain-containing protein [Mycobacteriales bacterium]